jgi:hypothetical protein
MVMVAIDSTRGVRSRKYAAPQGIELLDPSQGRLATGE